MKTQGSIEIDRPIAEVFAFTTGNVAEWSQVVVEEEVLEEKPGGVGTRVRIVTEEHGERMTFDGVVTRNEPPTAHTVEMTGMLFDIIADYTLEDLGGDRTRVTQDSEVTGKGFFRIVLFFSGMFTRKSGCDALAKELASLKRLLEERAAPSA